jgi:hypothetical protein
LIVRPAASKERIQMHHAQWLSSGAHAEGVPIRYCCTPRSQRTFFD